MLKYLVLFFISASCFASGKVSVEPEYYLTYKKPGAKVGLSVYEKILGPIHYNGWTGGGVRPKFVDGPVLWFVTHHALELWFGRVSIAPGYSFAVNNAESGLPLGPEHIASVKLQYKLW